MGAISFLNIMILGATRTWKRVANEGSSYVQKKKEKTVGQTAIVWAVNLWSILLILKIVE